MRRGLRALAAAAVLALAAAALAQQVTIGSGHPCQMAQIATAKCELDLVAMSDAGVASLIDKDPTLMVTEIPGGLYPRHPEPTRTFGTYVVLVADENAPDAAPNLRMLPWRGLN